MKVLDVIQRHEKAVVICRYRGLLDSPGMYCGGGPPVNPGVLLQVTLDAGNLSPSGKLIRFGGKGDEIVGWTDVEVLEVVEILGVRDGEQVVPVLGEVVALKA